MEESLARLTLADRITRFPAHEGDGRSAGISQSQLGCFLSHQALVRGAAAGSGYTLILEDDVVFPNHFARYLELVTPAILSQDCDIVFLNQMADFSNFKVVHDLLQAKRARGDIHDGNFAKFSLHDCKPYYAAGAAAYLVKPGAASKLLDILDQQAADGYPAPIDLVFRAAIRADKLSARFVFPFVLGTDPDLESLVVPDQGKQSGPLFNATLNLFVAGGDMAGMKRMAMKAFADEPRDVDALVAAHIIYQLLKW